MDVAKRDAAVRDIRSHFSKRAKTNNGASIPAASGSVSKSTVEVSHKPPEPKNNNTTPAEVVTLSDDDE